MLVYHGTSLENAVKISSEGFKPRYATHETHILERIYEYTQDKKQYSILHSRVSSRLNIRDWFGKKISFVDHFDIARIWAKKNRLSTEMMHCLLEVYDIAIELLPTNLDYEWYTNLKESHDKLMSAEKTSVPVVVTADIPQALLHKEGMRFKIPFDKSYLSSLEEYSLNSNKYENQNSQDLLEYLGYDRNSILDLRKIRDVIQGVQDSLFSVSYEYQSTQHIPAETVVSITSVKHL